MNAVVLEKLHVGQIGEDSVRRLSPSVVGNSSSQNNYNIH